MRSWTRFLWPVWLTLLLAAGCSSTGTSSVSTPRIAPPPATTVTTTTPAATGPVARGYAMMTDLPGETGVLLLGGADQPGPPDLPDMWSYEPKSGWSDITSSTLPESDIASGVVGNAFEFDIDSGLGVFADIEGNTYAYDPTTERWTAKKTKDGPTELLGSSMVYDAGSDRMIVFGGFMFDSGVNGETWAYDVDSNTWEHMHPKNHPSARNYSAMAYDAASDRVILFGGDNGTDVFGDTWGYDYESDSWTEMSPAKSPAARDYSWMVYDPGSDRMVLYGGSKDQETATLDDTWAYDYDRNRWTRLVVDGPSARAWHAMAYDDRTKTIVLFGGGTSRDEFTAETWIFDPRRDTWSQVA